LPGDIFVALRCGYEANWADFCDRGLDAQVARLEAQEGNPTTAPLLAAKLDREFNARAPWVPLWTPSLADFVSRRVGNYQYNTYDFTLLDQLWVK
jgi:ABC-type oligopeptide transport system substrate-binding subunit